MTNSEAILRRVSNRKYTALPLTDTEITQLNKAIDQCNRAGHLRFHLVTDSPEVLSTIKSYGLFSGVQYFVALVGPAADPHLEEKCGYYGEQFILAATAMGLGTCWVGGTYDRASCLSLAGEEEKLVAVIPVGHIPDQPGTAEKLFRSMLVRKSKSAEELSVGLADAPDYFRAGMDAVVRAPSARNLQPVSIHYENGSISAHLTQQHSFSMVDLGIAKYHFEIGAHGGTWQWGEGGTFVKAKEEKSCGAVIWRKCEGGHEYLLAQHGAKHWSFPKGHVENDETEVETAKREILEETGLTADIDTNFREVVTYYPKPNVIKDVVFFIATPTGGEEHAQEEEIRQLGWFSFEDSLPLVTFATDIDVLKAAEEYITSL